MEAVTTNKRLLSLLVGGIDQESYKQLAWSGTFWEYLDIVDAKPLVARNAYQRAYDMIRAYGTEELTRNKEKLTRFKFFADPMDNGKDAIFGLEKPLLRLVMTLKSASLGYGTEKRIILLHGPVGSSKSTIVRLLKKGLEEYSKRDEGALYTFSWIGDDEEVQDCPMHEEPLKLIPESVRVKILEEINSGIKDSYKLKIEGDLCPFCRKTFSDYLRKYEGDWKQVMNHVRTRRLTLSEKDRVGIGTFQPKDEKNQDSTELTGDINYRKIAEYGSDSDPRAFNFDGELNIANRGIVEFIEILKLDVAFLYDLLGASQEHKIKPKKFAQTDIDEIIIGHTNEPEYKKLQNNELMEAFRDRTVKIDIPYNIRLSDEIKIYLKDYNDRRVQGKMLAPHTIEVAAMWSVLTRLEEPKKAHLTLLQKLKLYDGKSLAGFTEESIQELQEDASREGLDGISPRYVQDKISNALVHDSEQSCVNPFIVMNELDAGLRHHSLITNENSREHYRELLGVVKKEYENIVKNEVQRAIAADDDALTRLCANYVDNIRAYTQREKVANKFTGAKEEPDERLMRAIEEKIDIPEGRKDDFRREIMNYIGALSLDGKKFDYKINERLLKALELKLFEDQKDTIKLTSLVSNVVDKETQEKIDVVKSRLIKDFGYCDICANDVLHFVASIFARGDVKD
ncbi:MAG: serine protein kinase [Planctomycetota bacterium]|nr:serine protein kinase [Planctomycetota bacterium]MDA1138664.1 serine protein kinase [Planctomycetota bacterium]